MAKELDLSKEDFTEDEEGCEIPAQDDQLDLGDEEISLTGKFKKLFDAEEEGDDIVKTIPEGKYGGKVTNVRYLSEHDRMIIEVLLINQAKDKFKFSQSYSLTHPIGIKIYKDVLKMFKPGVKSAEVDTVLKVRGILIGKKFRCVAKDNKDGSYTNLSFTQYVK